jgi:hypothetical protein
MPLYTVNTADDVVDASDGVLSLREAVAAAAGTADQIVFDASLNDAVLMLTLGTLEITTGGQVSINGDVDGDGSADVTLLAYGATLI